MIKNNRSAFTLAEMMIVMLILTILLAAFAPLMTKKSKVDLSNPWRWASNNSDIYYGMGNTQTAMIGQNNKSNDDLPTNLLINTGNNSTKSHIVFKNSSGTVGNLVYRNSNLLFGGPYEMNIQGTSNTGFGTNALNTCSDSSCTNNTAMGLSSLSSVSKSSNNVAIGVLALSRHTSPEETSGNNTAIGTYSIVGVGTNGASHTGYNNTALGAESGRRITSGHDNTAIGFAAGGAGQWAGEVANTGSYNTSLGSYSLLSNTSGSYNIAIGNNALQANTTGSNNVIIGSGAVTGGSSTSTSSKTYTATNCYRKCSNGRHSDSKSYPYCSGTWTIAGNSNLSSMSCGTLIPTIYYFYSGSDGYIDLGTSTSKTVTTTNTTNTGNVNYSVAIGSSACSNISNDSNNAICIGADSGPTSATKVTNTMYLGNSSIGTVYFGGNSAKTITTNATFSTSSDKRLKENITENNSGLNEIRKIKVYNYKFKNDKTKTQRVGVIAQELQKIFPSAITKDEKGYLSIRKEDMFYASINAIKELDKMLQDLIAQVKTVVAQVTEHDTQIKALQKENQELKNKVQNLEKQNKAFEKRLKAIEKKL